jgi:hypothetical protein
MTVSERAENRQGRSYKRRGCLSAPEHAPEQPRGDSWQLRTEIRLDELRRLHETVSRSGR